MAGDRFAAIVRVPNYRAMDSIKGSAFLRTRQIARAIAHIAYIGPSLFIEKNQSEAQMELDRQLVFAARRLITGANVHRINTLIFQYETAVRISRDDKTRGLDVQAKEYERRLRILVHEADGLFKGAPL